MTSSVREKLRQARLGTGEGLGYGKVFGLAEHRVVAEEILGRPLAQGETVHHVNGDKRDNRKENLYIFSSQSRHAKWHQSPWPIEGGDADALHTKETPNLSP